MTEPLFRLSGLTRDYSLPRESMFQAPRVTRALAPTDLVIEEGSSLGVIGESGSGKSTLVRLMLALDTATAGTVRFRGTPVHPGRRAAWFRRRPGSCSRTRTPPSIPA